MNKTELEKYLNEAIENIHEDRKVTGDLLKDLMQHIAQGQVEHTRVGQTAAKYVETLQRSNEQLVKIVALLQKRDSKTDRLSSQDKQELFDLIQGDQEDG